MYKKLASIVDVSANTTGLCGRITKKPHTADRKAENSCLKIEPFLGRTRDRSGLDQLEESVAVDSLSLAMAEFNRFAIPSTSAIANRLNVIGNLMNKPANLNDRDGPNSKV